MKKYEGKSVEEALAKASEELNVPAEKLKYEVISESKGLFKRSAIIGVIEFDDVLKFTKEYIANLLESIGLQADINITVDEDLIHVDMTSENDASKIIGKNGETLKAFNELTRSVLYNKYDKHYRVLLNINNYKDQKYEKIVNLATRVAKTVKRTKITADLSPMTSDERRVIHNALAGDVHIKTISVGSGKERHITIQYVNYVPKYEDSNKIDDAFEAKGKEISEENK
ncbi:MAG: RNA-binding cell elongation regulator Jag/EloR [Bacilli bacterium]